jgi:hypothetical protein
LNYSIKRIVHQYFDMTDLLHQAREAKLQLTDDAKFAPHSTVNRSHFTPRTTPIVEPTHNLIVGLRGNVSSKSDSKVSSAKRLAQPANSVVGSSNSTA